MIIEPEQLHSMAWGTYKLTRLVVARFSTFASGVVIPEARRLVPPACCSGFASCPAGHEGEPKGQLHVKTKTNKDNMAKLLIPGNGQRPPSVRSFDEVDPAQEWWAHLEHYDRLRLASNASGLM